MIEHDDLKPKRPEAGTNGTTGTTGMTKLFPPIVYSISKTSPVFCTAVAPIGTEINL